MNRLIFRWETALLAMLVAELAIFGIINPRFLHASNLIYGTSDFVQIGIVALPLTLVIIAGGIDVSFASVIGLAAIVFGVATFYGAPLPLSIALALVSGALCGLLNATVIHLSKIQPLVVTLGSLYLFQGTATVASGSSARAVMKASATSPTHSMPSVMPRFWACRRRSRCFSCLRCCWSSSFMSRASAAPSSCPASRKVPRASPESRSGACRPSPM